MFAKRLISAVVLLAAMVVIFAAGGYLLLGLCVIATLVGTYELLRAGHMEKSVPGYISYVSVIGFYLLLFFGRGDMVEGWIAAVVVLMLAAYVFTYPSYVIEQVSMCLLAVVYVGVLGSYLYQVRCLEYGNWFVWLILIGASGSDTFAYLVGRLWGKDRKSVV